MTTNEATAPRRITFETRTPEGRSPFYLVRLDGEAIGRVTKIRVNAYSSSRGAYRDAWKASSNGYRLGGDFDTRQEAADYLAARR